MTVIVLNTGTELLLGDVLNSHLSFIAREILPFGLRVNYQLAVPDGDAIRTALIEALGRAEVIFVTGGLGPTSDDITREMTADLLGLPLHHDAAVMTAIAARAARRGFRLTGRTSRQADVPEGATVLPNEYGSAPGLYFPSDPMRENRPHLFLLPGPPRELQPMFRSLVLPILRQITPPALSVGRRTYRIVGMGESLVEEAVGERLLEIPRIELGYCARPGEVDLRIIGSQLGLDKANEIIVATLGDAVVSSDGQGLEEVVVSLLAQQNKTLAVAESCTGGYLANRITNVPGASAVFRMGFVTYSNVAKAAILGVDESLISRHGAVSEEVALAMAQGAEKKANATFGLATTGIAGPSGATIGKPVGTVFIALATQEVAPVVKCFRYPDGRQTFKELASQSALEMVRKFLLGRQSGDR